ncbi:MAG: ATP-binding protein, partial [Polaromonas sp.]
MDWFNVDKKGLAKLLERKGKEFVLLELVQNAWDENSSRVDASLKRIAGTKFVHLTVEDDNPDGFADLSHAFTLFAESSKKGEAEKRGRFNLGEKLVLALCDEAKILYTKGGIAFDNAGRHTLRSKTECGSVFNARLRMTNEELQACHRAAATLLPPSHVQTFYNGELLASRVSNVVFSASLPTEIADAEGMLRRSVRITQVEILEPAEGETPMLYEMGIPVVETGDRWHVNVSQKIPLNLD